MAQKDRVLVWVADTELRIRLVNVINRLGKYQAIEYRSGAGELESLYRQRPQFVLIDIDYAVTVPEMVVKEIRRNLPSVLVIGLSGRWDETKRVRYESFFDSVLVMPFDADSFDRIADEAKSKNDIVSCDVLSFFAPKGKSGRTTLIVNLAIALARASGARVGIIDADTTFADMDAFLNLHPKSTIVEALRDINYLTPSSLGKYFEEINDNVQVLCGIRTPQSAAYVTADGIASLINMARRNFRYLLVDLAPGFNAVNVAASESSDHVYLTIMSAGAYEMRHLTKALDIFTSLDNWEKRVECVITRVQPDVHHRKALEEQLGCPVTLLPNEYLLCSQAANNGRMALDIGSNSTLTQQIDQMADVIVQRSR